MKHQNRTLEFGTGGIRGVMGPNDDQMNDRTIMRVVQGLSNYILSLKSAQDSQVVIAYDSRKNSKEFANLAALIFASNKIKTFLFDSLQPTPLLSYAVRTLKCTAGLCITASHNPPQYNGLKVYWDDGAQIVPPQDKEIVASIQNIDELHQIKLIDFDDAVKNNLIVFLKSEFKQGYLDDAKNIIKSNLPNNSTYSKDISIVYTPLHGTGYIIAPELLAQLNFNNVFVVPEQKDPDGSFPTVQKPNPEEPKALKLAIEYAHQQNADVVFGTDPDSDRLAVCVKDAHFAKNIYKNQSIGDYVLLNGNQTGALFLYFILENLKLNKTLNSKQKVVKTIVTSRLLDFIPKSYGIEVFNTPTGFKWIAMLIPQWEIANLSNEFIFGAEESFGYMFANNVRDKDAICAIGFAAEMVAYFKAQGKTLCNVLFEIFEKFGAWQEDLINIECEPTAEGMQKIQAIMAKFRTNSPRSFCGIDVENSIDYLYRESDKHYPFPQLDVLQYALKDNSQVSIRPSGTEPKLKIYLSVCTQSSDVEDALRQTHNKIQALRTELLTLVQ